jgi:hypothetical protein
MGNIKIILLLFISFVLMGCPAKHQPKNIITINDREYSLTLKFEEVKIFYDHIDKIIEVKLENIDFDFFSEEDIIAGNFYQDSQLSTYILKFRFAEYEKNPELYLNYAMLVAKVSDDKLLSSKVIDIQDGYITYTSSVKKIENEKIFIYRFELHTIEDFAFSLIIYSKNSDVDYSKMAKSLRIKDLSPNDKKSRYVQY